MNNDNNDNSIKRDIVIALIWVGVYYGVLTLTTFLDKWFGLTEAFTIVAMTKLVMKAVTASAISFLLTRIAFRHTIGKDIGKTFDDGWDKIAPQNKTKIIIAVVLVFFASIMLSPAAALMPAGKVATPSVSGLAIPVSIECRDKIIYYEVGGKSYYVNYLSKPTWPKGASGVTIGFGYDLGYNTPDQIRKDWGDTLDSRELQACISVAGKKGEAAKYALPAVRDRVRVTWDEALRVFECSTMPRFASLTKKAFILTDDRLHPHSNGALVSLVFNRGASMKGSSRAEMANIRSHIMNGRDSLVPAEITSMCRLWRGKGLDGLILRRKWEANQFQKGVDFKG